jgi:hypothetical protein
MTRHASRREHLTALLGALTGAVAVRDLAACDPSPTVLQTAPGSVQCVATMDRLRDLVGGDGSAVVLESYSSSATGTPPDGGGGVFYWDSSAATGDDGGTVIVPKNGAGGRWVRVYSGALNVRWFGAKGDGATFDDEAIARAIAAARARGGPVQPEPDGAAAGRSIEFPAGWYRFRDAITIGDPYIRLFSNDGAVLEQTTTTADLLTFTYAFDQQVRGLTFFGGASHIVFQTVMIDTIQLVVEDCQFYASADFSVLVPPVPASAGIPSRPGLLTIDRCKFYACAAVLNNNLDYAVVENTWVTTAPVITNGRYAVFENHGCLDMRDMIGVPSYSVDFAIAARWIDNYGHICISQSRLVGEGGGIATIFHFADLPADGSGVYVGSQIVIRDSAVFAPGAPTNAPIITVASGCPQRVVFEGNVGPSNDNPIVSAASGVNIAAHLAEHTQAAQLIVVSLDSDMVPAATAVDPALLRYVNPFSSSIFMTGQRPGRALQGYPSRSTYQYYLPKTAVGFTALVTISACPSSTINAAWRTTATYLLAMTTGTDLAVGNAPGYTVDVLTTQLLFAPQTPNGGGWLPAPQLIAATFDATGQSRRPWMPNQGGSFTLTWDSNLPSAEVTSSLVSIQPVHVLT